MLTLKYALRNVSRSKGRSILIGIIIVIIAFSVCIGLCIRQSAADAKETALSALTITAQISPDREAAMEKGRGGQPPGEGTFDKEAMRDAMGTALTLEELQKYAEAESVQNFYYTLSASVNASGSLEAYTSSNGESDTSNNGDSNFMAGKGGMFQSGDFTITGYSSDDAMTDFVDGTCTIEDGQVFDEGTTDKVCIIASELAEYNDLKVGDTIKIASTEDEDDTYKLKIVGIYANSQASAQAGGMGFMGGGRGGHGGFSDPANNIYTSYNTLLAITEQYETISGTLNGTYVVGDLESYEAFTKEVAALGLSDEYTVSSSDLTMYEQSARPLENLAKFAGYFLIVILLIGAVILIVLNIFATRERKYEIGVLSAIGMKKKQIAKLFLTEILIIALVGVIVGGGIGATASVPVTNALLESQVASQQEMREQRSDGFGREFSGMMPGELPADTSENADEMKDMEPPADDNGQPEKPDGFGGFVTEVSSSVNLVVLLELLVACIALALVGGMVSVIAIMRYEPLQILANRD